MKDLIIITSYCDTPEKENTLRGLVRSIKKEKDFFDLMIVSHLPIPEDIAQQTNISLYDEKNEILTAWNMRSTPWFNPNNDRPILSCFTGFFNVHLAIWRMLILGNSIAKNCGYKKIHHLEYDCEINNFNELKENSILLNSFDAVTYSKEEDTVDPILFGTYQSYNVDNLHTDLLILDENKIKQQIYESNHKSAEQMFFDLLNHNNNVFVKNKNLLDLDGNRFGLSHTDLSNKNTAWCLPYFDQLTEKLGFIIWNCEEPQRNISVKLIYNDNQVINIDNIEPKHWIINDIDDYINAKKLTVLLNNKVRNVYDFEKTREEFKVVSYREKTKKY